MRVEIQDVKDSSDARPVVQFSSEFGNARAHWSGDAPTPGDIYFVEFTVGGTLTWGDDILPIAESTPSLSQDGQETVIRAKLESHEDDGVAFLRVGDSLLMAETQGAAPPVGSFVEARVRDLSLSDTGI
jgi:hypothetical protein